MTPLTGYCDRWSVKSGETIRFMVGSAGDAPFTLRFLRHLCADPNPAGPGYREIEMPAPLDGARTGLEQRAWLGSFGHASGLALDLSEGASIGATVWPTTPLKGEQGIVVLAGESWTLALGIGTNGAACARVVLPDGRVVSAQCTAPMLPRRWYDLALSWSLDGSLRVSQIPRTPVGHIVDRDCAAAAAGAPSEVAKCDVFLAAMPPSGDGAPATAHFNGKLERPTVWKGTLDNDAVLSNQRADVSSLDPGRLLACWDFAREIGTPRAVDIGPSATDARLINLPTRAMTGARWTGDVHDWTKAPSDYAAIHFHDDDQGDLGWRESFALTVPADWPSGFYSAHIRNDAGEDLIPFFVRPQRPRADVAFLVPTFTYQVYGCFVRAGRGAEIAERVAEWGALKQTPDMNPQFGLSAYNFHSDGSGVCITTMLRPMLDTRPRQMSLMDPAPGGSGTGRICSDSYFIGWLDSIGVDCDVITDHDLHAEGAELLAPYRVVIAGQHPEYHSERMMQSLEAYLGGGGRLMYLGGNGFYWRAEPSQSQPDAIEIRRAESGIRVWASEPGEYYQAFGGGYGGLWRRIGRSAHRLVGNGFSAQGRHSGFPYRFTDGIRDPRVAFMLDGLDVKPGEVFGDEGFMGGGAAGFELDSADEKFGTPPNTLIVAKGIVIDERYGPVNEDRLTLGHPRPQEDWSCADMLFFETAAGGAVFSVGSMTYAGSMPVGGYRGTVARLTENVLRRFRDPTPFK